VSGGWLLPLHNSRESSYLASPQLGGPLLLQVTALGTLLVRAHATRRVGGGRPHHSEERRPRQHHRSAILGARPDIPLQPARNFRPCRQGTVGQALAPCRVLRQLRAVLLARLPGVPASAAVSALHWGVGRHPARRARRSPSISFLAFLTVCEVAAKATGTAAAHRRASRHIIIMGIIFRPNSGNLLYMGGSLTLT
jgi:hypothetical protein